MYQSKKKIVHCILLYFIQKDNNNENFRAFVNITKIIIHQLKHYNYLPYFLPELCSLQDNEL